MRKFLLAGAAAATLLAAPLLSGSAGAAPLGAAGFQGAGEHLNLIEKTQFVFGGRRHCWYADGWKGPGWYWCGYRTRVGFGWGGGAGYRGWTYRAPAVVVRPRGPAVVVRPGPRRRAPAIVIRP